MGKVEVESTYVIVLGRKRSRKVDENKKYEILLQKANDIWDEFTTGTKGKKK